MLGVAVVFVGLAYPPGSMIAVCNKHSSIPQISRASSNSMDEYVWGLLDLSTMSKHIPDAFPTATAAFLQHRFVKPTSTLL